MTQQDQLKQIEELWDSLSPELKTIFSARFEYQKTIKNTSNASSHIQVLEEENSEMCEIHSVDASGKCFKCGSEPFGHFAMCQDCLEFNHSGNGNF